MRSFFRPDIDVNVVGPVVAVVAEYMPAEIVSLKPGLVPSSPLISEVLDIRSAKAAPCACAYLPFKRPVIPGPGYLGPEWQPLFAKYAGYGLKLSRASLDVVLIASAY